MMLIIADKEPKEAIKYLFNNMNKSFCFKQLIELGQLVCSCGISNEYKKVYQGKAIQEWINKNPYYVKIYFAFLLVYCLRADINISEKSTKRLIKILKDLCDYSSSQKEYLFKPITTAIFRYSKDYECKIFTNTELPIEECIEQYKKYIEWKKKKNVKGY